MRMLDLFCGRGGWTDDFLARGWKVVGVDLVRHPDYKGDFVRADVFDIKATKQCISIGNKYFFGRHNGLEFDFICASSPCEQFSVHGLRCFYPNPPYPELGIKLFNHTRSICEASGVPYVMENVRSAQQFVGHAEAHCGPFFLWGNAIPPLLPQGIMKGRRLKKGGYKGQTQGKTDKGSAAIVATIPPELAGCVADYAERVAAQVETVTI